jgi:methionyl-tRNA formyltransferase
MQPPKLKDPQFIQNLRALNADVHVVVAFRMLPEAVWSMPPMGTINVHGSLLPQYRGAAPINWAIINGEIETGVTTFRLKHEIDTGNLLLQDRIAILPEDNAGSIHDKLMVAGAELLVKTLDGLAKGTIQPQPQQEDAHLKHAPKIFKEDTRVNWEKGAEDVHNFIRGLSPHPTAFTTIGQKTMKIYRSRFKQESHNVHPGTPETDAKTYLRVAASDGWVYLEEVQQEGKKRMLIADFLRGFRL